jgi:hypothetical protein
LLASFGRRLAHRTWSSIEDGTAASRKKWSEWRVLVAVKAGWYRAGTMPPGERSDEKATDFENRHDPARLEESDGPDVRRILVEREMRANR